MSDTHAEHAERGAEIVRQYLHRAPGSSDISDRIMRANWYVGEVCATAKDSWSQGVSGLRDALVDLLHHADGWHTPTAVLDTALSAVNALPAGWAEAYSSYGAMPQSPPVEVPEADDVHDLRAIVGAATEVLMAGPAQHPITANDLADEAETQFMDEAESARFGAVRNARTTA